ncbi:MAG: cytochrome c oxidase subunit 3 [Flavobacteriaceae bacterium]|nr:cytochrome c oxidase subunit 3 [Flavobacteriaceae bacterium]
MEQKEKTYKQMLWVSMISMTMMFAGLTSAYVVSKNREDWVSFELPTSLYISTLLIILSSITFYLAKKFIKKNDTSKTSLFLILTLGLGLGFVYFQFHGFKQLIDAGFYFTGKQSNVSTSFLYVIVITHLIHIFAGIIVLFTVLFQNSKGKYKEGNTLGLELGAIFWHFVDALWIYLFLFFYFLA